MALEIPGVRSFENNPALRDPARAQEDELGKTAFLELMIAQIKNQDPLEPAKNEAFIAQLAQFSSLEGIQNMNESMEDLVTSMRAGLTMDAAGLVGRNVLVPTNQTRLNTEGGLGGTIAVSEPAANLTVEITTTAGDVVKRFDLGSQASGPMRFAWDGISESGEQVPFGVYRVNAFAEVDGLRTEFEVNLPEQVVSVSIEEGGLVANLAGGTSVPAVQIKEIQ
jgi:flagellar basal-body rod modification protein FlgD